MTDRDTLHKEAIAQGYKDETCRKCKILFEANIHFIRCDAVPCPMKSKTDPRSFLEMWRDS